MSRRTALWIAALLLLAAALRFAALDYGLPHPLTRPDEAPVVQRTVEVARGEPNLKWVLYPSAYVYLCWVHDHLTTSVTHYVSRDDFAAWLQSAGLSDIRIRARNGNSWSGLATRS